MATRVNANQVNLQDDKVVKINRSSATVKGGRRFSFGALVVTGDGHGAVGWGLGKGRDAVLAIGKGGRNARKTLYKIPMHGTTIPHEVIGKFGASSVKLIPAAPGTGVIAGTVVRSVLESAGIQDVLTKVYGSNNALNLIQATFDGLLNLRSKEEIETLRGVKIG